MPNNATPLISVIVPVYNAEDYLRYCIDSILQQSYTNLEVILVDDGAKDSSPAICDEYAAQDSRVTVIHQENGGHGQAVNTGIKNATGLYFKVVDSDDWVNEEAYQKVLETLRKFVYGQETIDMLVTNFVYEKEGAKRKKVMNYHTAFPRDKVFTWKDVKFFMTGQYILMHSVIYRTELLRQCGLELPKHTFYVDNLFAFEPLPFVKNMYYLDVNFYRYFIGRDDQSVNEKVMIKRIDQQIRVNKLMADAFHNCQFDSKHLKKYMLSYLDIITTVSSIMLVRAGTQEALDKKKEMLEYIREQDLWLYHKLRYSILGRAANLPGRGGRKMFVAAYKVCQKFYGFN